MTVVGLAILIYRRRTVGPVFSATTRNDKAMYVVLAVVILAGTGATVWNGNAGYDYRETISPYFRSIFYGNPHADLISGAPLAFKIHIMAAWTMFAMWPFTRLVHVFSAPLGYLTRPYIVYRSREHTGLGPARRGWEGSSRPM